jgi:hypothetical protein
MPTRVRIAPEISKEGFGEQRHSYRKRLATSPCEIRGVELEKRRADYVARILDGARARDLIVTASALATRHRDLIITLAARHKQPSVYPSRYFVAARGLISYGPDSIDQYRRAAGYVDRILPYTLRRVWLHAVPPEETVSEEKMRDAVVDLIVSAESPA